MTSTTQTRDCDSKAYPLRRLTLHGGGGITHHLRGPPVAYAGTTRRRSSRERASPSACPFTRVWNHRRGTRGPFRSSVRKAANSQGCTARRHRRRCGLLPDRPIHSIWTWEWKMGRNEKGGGVRTRGMRAGRGERPAYW
jgi:hypothetical protein